MTIYAFNSILVLCLVESSDSSSNVNPLISSKISRHCCYGVEPTGRSSLTLRLCDMYPLKEYDS
jgi:hypothetical protein